MGAGIDITIIRDMLYLPLVLLPQPTPWTPTLQKDVEGRPLKS